MAKTNTKPLSGMRDFLPLDVLRRRYVLDTIETVYQRYGFEPLETPAMERLDTLLGKYGDEGDQLIFRVMKRGDKLDKALRNQPTEASIGDAGLRYDLTVPLARVAAEYRSELPRYFKRYQIQPVFRADRPARGRYREFYQCDLDIVGSASQTVEAEVLAAATDVFEALGFSPTQIAPTQTDGAMENSFAIRLNHRSILRGLMETAGVPNDAEGAALVAIDKLDKIGVDGVRRELLARGLATDIVDRLLDAMHSAPAGEGTTNVDRLGWLGDLLEDSERGAQGVAALRDVLRFSAETPAARSLRIDPFIARGLSYYTGAIFEAELTGFGSSVGAGGRYDELVGIFSGQALPACGFSLGLERILLIMEERGLFPDRLAGQPQLLVTQFDESTVPASLALAHELRQANFRVDLYPDTDRYGRQFQYAEARGIRYALLLGPNEIEQNAVAVKDLESGAQVEVARVAVAGWLSERVAEL